MPLSLRVSATGIAVALGVMPGAAPAQSRLERQIDESIVWLDDPGQRLDALRRLENFGPLALPELCARLHWQRRGGTSRQVQADLLYALSRLGRLAMPALPQLRDWLLARDDAVADQLIATLSVLAPHLDEEQAAALRQDLMQVARGAAVHDLDVLHHQLILGAAPSLAKLVQSLESDVWGGSSCLAACRWLHAHGASSAQASLPDDWRTQLLEVTLEQLQRATTRRAVSFYRGASRTEAELAEACLTLAPRPLDALLARALLSHRRPEQRLRAVLWLEQGGRTLPVEERADLVARLWDGDLEVATRAARALGRWGGAGVIALPALSTMLERHDDERMRCAATAAVAAITADTANLPPADASWLQAAADVLRGQAVETPTAPATATTRQLLAELLALAQWQQAARAVALLQCVQPAAPDAAMVGAVYGWLMHDDHVVVDAALSWLAHNREHVARAVDDRGGGESLVNECAHLARSWVPQASCPVAIEATAWFLTRGADVRDLLDLLDSGNTRLLARALAELLLRPPDRLRARAPRLQQLAQLPASPGLQVHASSASWGTFDYDLRDPVRVLAAMALAHAGVVADDQDGLAALVQQHCGCTLAELPTAIATRAADGTLAELVEALEAACRRQLYVPAELTWPRAGAR